MENNSLLTKSYDYLTGIEKRVYTELIPWCDKNNKKIYEVPHFDENGKLFSLYSLVTSLKTAKNRLDKKTIEILEDYGMYWLGEFWDYRVRTIILPYCNEHKCATSNIPSQDSDGKVNNVYVIFNRLKKKLLTEPNIISETTKRLIIENDKRILKEKGIDTSNVEDIFKVELSNKEKPVSNNKILSTIDDISACATSFLIKKLTDWCDSKLKYIYQIKEKNQQGKTNELYKFVLELQRRKSTLKEDEIAILDDYGMTWANRRLPKTEQQKEFDNKIYRVSCWCKKHYVKICDIKKPNSHSEEYEIYEIIQFLIKNIELLTDSQIRTLENHGLELISGDVVKK